MYTSNNELKYDLIFNLVSTYKTIQENQRVFDEIKYNFKNNDALMAELIHIYQQQFNQTILDIYQKLTKDDVNDIQSYRNSLTKISYQLLETSEDALKKHNVICEAHYLKMCDDTQERMNEIDGFIAIVC